MRQVAIFAAKKAGALLLKNFGKSAKTSLKEQKDIVTENDLKSENIIINTIRKKYPDHQILSEEIGELKGKSDYLWIIDPLDATVNYSKGLPLFSVSIGLLYKGKIKLGVIYAPYLNELFVAEKGKGAYLNGKKISVSTVNKLDTSIINIGLSAHYSNKLIKATWEIAKDITPALRGIRAFESGALTSCYVAVGKLDAKISIKTDPFGNAASTMLIEEAGGKVTDFNNKPWNKEMKTMICTNGILHNQILSFIRKYKDINK